MKVETIFVCSSCSSQFPKWTGRCVNCGKWNTLAEERRTSQKTGASAKPAAVASLGQVQIAENSRFSSGLEELDAILGDGFVPGSLVLLGGDPGIGKSTLALQAALSAAHRGLTTLYVSGEESLPQIKLRGQRLDERLDDLLVVSETSLETVLGTVEQIKPQLLVIDSIQTLYSENVSGVAGGMAQVSAATARILETSKPLNVTTLIIGHVTKEGNLAGPRLLEHMVDVVLYLEGERFGSFRILRCVKNRFGTTNEVGVFEMKEKGMEAIADPSRLFLAERVTAKPGNVVTATVDGSRALLLEIQALVSRAEFSYPKRTATGFDYNRLQLLTAVISKSLRLDLSQKDLYVSVAGGYRIAETACDLAVALSVVSSYKDTAFPDDTVVLGELGLSGEVRRVTQSTKRLKEAEKLGFTKALVPVGEKYSGKIKTLPVHDLPEAVKLVLSSKN